MCKLGIQSWQVKVCALLLVSFLFVINRSIKNRENKKSEIKKTIMQSTDTGMKLDQILSLLSLTFAAFIFNTSEFIPIGLLTDIRNDFGLTEQSVAVSYTHLRAHETD